MKLQSIVFRPVAEVYFTMPEIALMTLCSRRHYDAHCKEASKHGGFLYGMRNASGAVRNYVHTLTWGQLDTLAKIMEVGSHFPCPHQASRAFALGLFIHSAMRQLIEATPPAVQIARTLLNPRDKEGR